jgi:hypothetical protein
MTEPVKIESPIVGYAVNKAGEESVASKQAPVAQVEREELHEGIKRDAVLEGKSYKIKPPTEEHALYVTINDIVLNAGTEHEVRRPFEMFVNSKNMDHFQWIVALTRIVSAVFRKGGDCTFLVEELQSVFDPKGGYFKKGGRYMPSLVAEIGDVLRQHMEGLGMIEGGLDENQRALIEAKRAEYEAKQGGEGGRESKGTGEPGEPEGSGFPESAQLCQKCHTKAVVMMDGCMTCLQCATSKCS